MISFHCLSFRALFSVFITFYYLLEHFSPCLPVSLFLPWAKKNICRIWFSILCFDPSKMKLHHRNASMQKSSLSKQWASFLVTPSGIEPELPPWKGGVLTAWPWSHINRQRPTFPGSFPPSIIGAKELNFCVRDGNRCDLLAIVTGFLACEFSYAIFHILYPEN